MERCDPSGFHRSVIGFLTSGLNSLSEQHWGQVGPLP
jgi:hypothetical protein